MTEFDYETEFSQWKWSIPERYNIAKDIIDDKAEDPRFKNKVALYWENAEGAERKYTFWEMRVLTDKFGNVLRELGLKKGDRYLLRIPNIPEFQIAFAGGLKIGAVPIPTSVMFRPHEIEYRIRDSGSKIVITTPEYVKDVEEIYSNCPSLEDIMIIGDYEKHLSFRDLMKSASRHLEIEDTRSDDWAFIMYTSGTTGDPKGTVHAHRWAIANDPSVIYWQDGRVEDIVAHTGQLNWIYPLGNAFIYAWRHALSVLLYDGRFDPRKWFSLMEKYEVTNLASVPTAYRMFLTVDDYERYDLKLRHCISAGEPLNPEVYEEWKKRFGVEILDGIGMTEIMVYLSNQRGMKVKPGSCGRPQPGHICAIVDEHGKPVSPFEQGTLAIRSDDPGLFIEYLNKPEKTAECFVNGWFLSGDTLYMDEDGYYWFSGRGDDLIKASGYRISPFEVESAVNQHPAVLESAAVASPDSIRGNIIKVFVILNDGYEPSEELAVDIMEFVKRTSAPYKYPRAIEFVRELPKTQSGKIKRKLLREIEQEKAKKGDLLTPQKPDNFLYRRSA